MAVVAASSFAVASGAMAQTAVQWPVSEGGNGHWYAERASLRSQPDAVAAAALEGGHLVSIGSAAENSFLVNQHYPYGPFSAPVAHWTSGVRASSGAWTWSTGEQWSYSNFDAGEPNGCCGSDVRFVLIRTYPGHEGAWDDTSTNGNGDQAPQPSIVEWDADCNADGLVDFGEIRDGLLADVNGNNVPDCCEQDIACSGGPLQWKVADGGNGHWYSIDSVSTNWSTARDRAASAGGYLASVTSQAEQMLVTRLVGSSFPGTWIGGFQSDTNCGANCGWAWVSGEPWSFTAWGPGEPNDYVAGESFLEFYWRLEGWNDSRDFAPVAKRGIIEWSADCNNDGIVDYGQIRDGTLADSNGDNIPDVCDAGFVMSWGSNDYGESVVPSGLGLVKAIDAGSYHSVALKADGGVVCWGAGTTASGIYPHFGQSQVPAGLAGVVDVAAAGMHTVALRSDGSIASWGANDYGQSSPPGKLGPVKAIAAGFAHTVALLPDGTVRCWGRNNWGECNVPSGLNNVANISAGDTHVIVRKVDGSVVAWGNNFYGQLGIPQGLPPLASVRSKGNHNVGRTPAGEVWCWQFNSAGQCTVPAKLGMVDVATPGGLHTLAIRHSGTLACWGSNSNSQCNVPAAAAHVLRVAGGDRHTVAIVALPDADHDGIPDASDNCVSIANSDQADCNSNGIGDVCEIAAGTLLDANHNNIPDCCENGGSCDPCRADVDQSGAVNGVDLAAVLNNWGTAGGKQPRSDINHDGIVNGSDLAEVLNAWGACH